jgi:hypothetical protein
VLVDGPSERRSQVGGQAICLACRLEFVRADQRIAGETGCCGQMDGVAVAALGERPRSVQVITAVRSHRLEVAVAGRSRSRISGAHRPVHQSGDDVEHVEFVQRRVAGDRDRITDREPSDEDRQPVEHHLLTFVEQHVRPIERRQQRLLTSGAGAPPA